MAVKPDNITLSVNLESNSQLNERYIQSVDSISVGTKEYSIKINESAGFGTETKLNNSLNDKCSLSESEAQELGQIGLSIHSYFGFALVIQWGIKNGIFYLFQCRPVTNIDSYNEWELMHELDSGHNDQNEYHSRVGEVFPEAMSHLFITTIFRELGLYFDVSHYIAF